MAKRFTYEFEWDPTKARDNVRKHRIAFARAATIFLDPEALSELDEEESGEEDRWITLGLDRTGVLLVVCHTYREETETSARISVDFCAQGPLGMKRNIMRGNSTMKREYDFAKGVRGKFYRKGAELRLPIYLDAKLQEQVERLAEKNGKDIGEMVNQLVRKEVELIEELS